MSDFETLSAATRALREELSDAAANAVREREVVPQHTRARLMVSAHRARAGSRQRWFLGLPALLLLLGSTAFAAAGGHLGDRAQQAMAWIGLAQTPEPVPPAAVTAASPARRQARIPETPASPAVSVEPVETPPPSAASSAADVVIAPATTATHSPAARARAALASSATRLEASGERAPAGSSAAAGAAVDPDPALEVYTRAHQLHFREHAYAAAVDAYEAYLQRSPTGRFALEARYNRAICLVRAGRRAEARAALTSFALGTAGGYRQAEASALLEALGD